MPPDSTDRRARTVHLLERATGRLANATIARMEERFPWYRSMPADERSWVGLVIQAGIAAFVDAEHALDPEYAKAIGVDTDALLVSQPDTGEQALEITETLVRSGGLDVIVVDSVAALVPRGAATRSRPAATAPEPPDGARSSHPPPRSSRGGSALGSLLRAPPTCR